MNIDKSSMTPRRQRFAAEYAVVGDTHQAALRAGYPEEKAATRGQELLALPEVAEAVAVARGDAQAHDAVTRQWVVARLKEVAERSMQAVPAAPARGAAGDGGVWKFDAGAAIRALGLLGKHLRMFTDRDDLGEGAHETALDELE